jgi:hypothetical protein
MYKLIKNFFGDVDAILMRHEDGSLTSIPLNEANTDYQAYLAWIDAGNTPEPAEENT